MEIRGHQNQAEEGPTPALSEKVETEEDEGHGCADTNLRHIVEHQEVAHIHAQKQEMLRQVTEDNKDNHTAHLIHINKVEGKVSIASNEASHFSAKGTWITPEFDNPKKKRKVWPWIVGIAIVAVIAAGISFFICGGKNNGAEVVTTDSIKSDSVKVQPIEQKDDTLKKDTAKHRPVTSLHHDVVQKNKPLKDEKDGKDKLTPTKTEQPAAKKRKEETDVVNKFVKPSQSTKEGKGKTTNPNEKKI